MKYTIAIILICSLLSCSEQKSPEKMEETKPKVNTGRLNKGELAKLLPTEIDGYSPREEAKGLDINAANGSFSFSTQYYYKGNDSINIELHDYKDLPEIFEHYANLWWNNGDNMNNNLSFGNGIVAYEVYEHAKKRSTVYVGIDDRFYMIFECLGKENIGFMDKIAKSYDYASLRR